jgi:uncharacterized membrane protein
LYGVVLAVCLIAAIQVIYLLVRDEPAGDPTFVTLGIIEVLLVIQMIGGFIALAMTDRDVDGLSFGSYLVGVALAPVLGAVWSLAERNRAGTTVLLVEIATVAALEVRLWTIWGAGA